MENVIHIETAASDTDENWDKEITTVVMECGATCVVRGDGVPQPEMDWCSGDAAADVATCKPCRTAVGLD